MNFNFVYYLAAWKHAKATFESAGNCRDTRAIWAAAVSSMTTKLSPALEIWPGWFIFSSYIFSIVGGELISIKFDCHAVLCGTSKRDSKQHLLLDTLATSCLSPFRPICAHLYLELVMPPLRWVSCLTRQFVYWIIIVFFFFIFTYF